MIGNYFDNIDPSFAGLLRAIPDLLFVTDENGTFLDFNIYTSIPLALPREKIIGSSEKDLGLDSETIARLHRTRSLAKQTGNTQKSEYFLLSEHGERSYFDVRIAPLEEDRFLSVVTDITATKLMMEKMNMLSLGISESIDGIAVADNSGEIIFYNRAWAHMHGYTEEEIVKCNIRKFHTKEQFIQEVEPFNLEVEQKGSLQGEVGHLRKDGTIFPSWMSTNVLKDDLGRKLGFIGIARDITSIKLRELELEKARESAIFASESKSRFLASLSHEIRTPMNGIIGLTQILLSSEISDETRDYLNMILSSSHNLMNVVNDILDFARIEAGKFDLKSVEFELREVIAQAISSQSWEARRKNIDLNYNFSSDLPDYIISDPIRITQIIINIIGNAIRTSSNKPVKVSITPLNIKNNNCELHISINDFAPAITLEDLDTIWETVDKVRPGFGLSITKRLVELLGGKITVRSHKDLGNTFSIFIPVKMGSRISEKIVNITSSMIMCPDSFSCNGLVNLLEHYGISTIPVNDPLEALSFLESSFKINNPPEIVFLDGVINPEASYDLLLYIKNNSEFDSSRIIVIGGPGDPGLSEKFKSIGVEYSINKPIIPSNLSNLLSRIYHSRSERRFLEKLPDLGGCSALVCEDNPVNLKLAKVLLEKLGCRVDTAVNGIEAVEKTEKKYYQLILMDVEMPSMNGLAATRHIRKTQQITGNLNSMIIGLTAGVMPGDKEKCLESGMDLYIAKPLKIDEFYITLSNFSHRFTCSEESMIVTDYINIIPMKERFGNDFELIRELIEMFELDYNKYLINIKKAIDNKDPSTIKKNAHTLKGAISNFDPVNARSLAQEIENLSSIGDFEGITQRLAKLETEIPAVIQSVKNIIESGWPCN